MHTQDTHETFTSNDCATCGHDQSSHGAMCWEESANGQTCGCGNFEAHQVGQS